MRILLCLVACLAVATSNEAEEVDPHVNPKYYTNVWAVKIPGGPEVAKKVAEARGFHFLEPLPMFDDHYMLQKADHPEASDQPANHHTRSLLHHKDVHAAYQQHVLHRDKRGELKGENLKQISTRQTTSGGNKGCYSWMTSPYVKIFNDPKFYLEWYLLDYRKDTSETQLDLNVIQCWMNNITGRGVNIQFVDDGVDYKNEDLYANYNPRISVDLIGKDNDPTPVYNDNSGDKNSHGTRCAGEAAMIANNGICGVGISYNCNFGGVRLLDGAATDALEAQALRYMCVDVDISSNSWGPADNAKITEAIGPLTLQAMEYCIAKGRKGRGTIYIFACGNGKMYGDSCAADGFTQSIYTMAIASASQTGECPFYSEECAGVIGTAYSSGSSKQEMVLTTDIRNACVGKHCGTSAAAPMVSGIYALVLEANPYITWRDAQYLAVMTCEVAPLANNEGWQRNGANFYVSNKFGFGLFNAYNMVKMAKSWVNVPPKNICELSLNVGTITLPVGKMTTIPFKTDGCAGTADEVKYLEHVELVVTINSNFRGSISIYITSPQGTKTLLYPSRSADSSTAGLKSWQSMSLQQFGEDPAGQWAIGFYIEDIPNMKVANAQLTELMIRFNGPVQEPNCYKSGPRKYAPFALPAKKRRRRSVDNVEEIVLEEMKPF